MSHAGERGFTGEMAAATVMLAGRDFGARGRFDRGDGRSDRPEGRFDRDKSSGEEE